MAATVTLDAAGRFVIPKALRDELGFLPGVPLEVRVVGGHLELSVAPLAVRVDQRGGVAVAVASPGALTSEAVEAARASLRRGGT